MKKFNTTAVCIPEKHYMVDLTDRCNRIKKMVDDGDYFVINRARQYGKTTTLNELRKLLKKDYQVVSLDFQSMGAASYSSEGEFSKALASIICEHVEYGILQIGHDAETEFHNIATDAKGQTTLSELFKTFRKLCATSDKKVVLIADEVDSASNNQVFLDFLAQLREGYINRDTLKIPAFQSVILAGVNDIKHLRSGIRDDKQHKLNSPWNIAADFNIDMSFSQDEIKVMLDEYMSEHQLDADTHMLATSIRDYTHGYPFLVSRICQLIDERLVPQKFDDLKAAWSSKGFNEAVKLLLAEKNSLFESLTAKLSNFPRLADEVRSMLMEGRVIAYNSLQESISQMEMYGFIRNEHNVVVIDNRIFEMLLYNLFLSDEELGIERYRVS